MSTDLTVLMSVYNGESFLAEAIESILNQTLSDFEFIIIDDDSNDGSAEIIRKYSSLDRRIRVYKNPQNLGLSTALNIGLRMARTPYIARLDADDVSVPHRLKTQLSFMRAHPEIDVCGSWLEVYEQPGRCWRLPEVHEAISAKMLFECSIFHPTAIYKKDVVLNRFGGYASAWPRGQDYDLWQRMEASQSVRFANIAEPLLRYRIHPQQERSGARELQLSTARNVRRSYLKTLGLADCERGLICHEALAHPSAWKGSPSLKTCDDWLGKIEAANDHFRVYSPVCLRREFETQWLRLCLRSAEINFLTAFRFLNSPRISLSIHNLSRARRMLGRSISSRCWSADAS